MSSYKDKLEGSEKKALNKIVATKILRDMENLRTEGKDSETSPRRWVWELIQNARDVNINGKVKIEIVPQQSRLIFKHNGAPFTADNIRFLIEQISSKERGKDESGNRKASGKFGTGFLTTHLLSEKVFVKGIAKEKDLDYAKFELTLDRSGNEPDEIIESVELSKKELNDLDNEERIVDYLEEEFNTSFNYELLDETGKLTAKTGILDLRKCMPQTLIFNKEIESLHVLGDQSTYQLLSPKRYKESEIFINEVQLGEKDFAGNQTLKFASLSMNKTCILVPIIFNEEFIEILPQNIDVPKLFCDFPLVGSEKFSFPVLVNNPNFNPNEKRNGIFLKKTERNEVKVQENIDLIKEAISLYFLLLETAAKYEWKNLHYLADISSIPSQLEWVTNSWFKSNILEPIQKKLLYSKIVRTASEGVLQSILNKENSKKVVWFPNSHKKEIRNELWKLANYWFPNQIPHSEDVEMWHKLSWKESGKLTLDQFAQFISQNKISELSEKIKNKNVFEWLGEFYSLLEKDEKEYHSILSKREIIPNQNGDFNVNCLKNDVDGIDDLHKDVLKLLGEDIRDELLAPEIALHFPKSDSITLDDVVIKITAKITDLYGSDNLSENEQEAFSILLRWFNSNPSIAKQTYKELFRKKHYLYDEDTIVDNINKAEQLDNLLSENGIDSIDELKKLLRKKGDKLLPITEDLLVSMGITSIEEWEEAMKDQDIAKLFDHQSTPNHEMFLYVQALIKQAKANVLSHLQLLNNYDVGEADLETAPTIIAGVIKDEREISIVARPVVQGQVIIYYGSEKDVLDYEDSELWVDGDTTPRKITLGHVLKTAKIRKFPV